MMQEVVHNEAKARFEIDLGDDMAYLEYRWYKKNLALMHTWVPPAHEGKGIAASLAKYVLEYAKEKNLQIMVYCPYVASYLKRHPEYADLVDKKYLQ